MRSRSIINALVGLLFIASAGFGLYLLLRAAWGGFTSLGSGTASAVTAAAGAVLLACINLIAQRYIDRRRDIELRQREKKIELYQKFVTVWFGFLISPESRRARAQGVQNVESVLPDFNDITQQLILWGSDSVLKSYSNFRRLISNSNNKPSHQEMVLAFEALLLQFCKDLGHGNRGLDETDILALFINDVDSLRPQQKGNRSGNRDGPSA